MSKPVFAGITNSLSVGWVGGGGGPAHAQLFKSAAGCSSCEEQLLARCSAVHAAQRRGGWPVSYLPPVSHWQVLRLGQNRLFSPPLGFCIHFVHPCRHQQRPCFDESPPAESGILTVGTMRQALFWAPSHLPGDDNFWFSGKCVVSSPNIL